MDANNERHLDDDGDDIDALNAREIDSSDGQGNDGTVWLRRARQLYEDSTDYYHTSLFECWRGNISHFRSEHAPDSKYTQGAYRHRSKVFRPKPRAAVRTLEATAAAALFTNKDLIDVSGADPDSAEQSDAAKLHQALLQHRLENTIPWFLTVIGAYQDTHVYGVCISRQYWDYRVQTQTEYIPAMDEFGQPMMDEEGMLLGEEVEHQTVKSDRPAVDLIAPDNFRFDPACDWRDPVNTSPYLIEVIAMYAGDVQAMMDQGWHEHTLGELVAHGTDNNDAETVRDARRGRNKEDETEVSNASEYSVIWVHRNVIRDKDGQDWGFYTVGTGLILTDPEPLEEFDPLGRQGYAVGISSIEAHNTHPQSTIELVKPLTEMTNDVTNQRLDNVKLVLNKRYAIRRNANIDLGALMRNVPGGGVMMDDVQKDYRIMETQDVTQSSYEEQNRLAVESDELLGTFSQASVGNNRALNETVGGMNLMAQGANQVQELGLRTFIETWVEPVLRSLVKLEALYETDETILGVAARKAEIHEAISEELFMQDLVVRVNVGMGNTNPQQKLQRFLAPLETVAKLPDFVAEMDWLEVGKEVFAMAGQGDGSRFMLTEEKKAERQKAMGEGEQDPRIAVEQMRQEAKGVELEIKQMEAEQDAILRQMKIESDKEVSMAKMAMDKEMKLTELYEKLGIEQESLQLKARLEQARTQTQRDIAALKAQHENLTTKLQAENLSLGYDTF